MITPTGLPSTRTGAASDFSSSATASGTGWPPPIIGSGGPMCFSMGP